MSKCPHVKQVTEFDGDPEDKCGLVAGISCWGPNAAHCPMKEKKMSKLKSCPFCGYPAIDAGKIDSQGTLEICCSHCGSMMRGLDHDHLIKDWNLRPQPTNAPLTLKQLRGMALGFPLWKEEPPRGDMTESRMESVLFNGIHCGNEERVCWVTCEAHHANARVEDAQRA